MPPLLPFSKPCLWQGQLKASPSPWSPLQFLCQRLLMKSSQVNIIAQRIMYSSLHILGSQLLNLGTIFSFGLPYMGAQWILGLLDWFSLRTWGTSTALSLPALLRNLGTNVLLFLQEYDELSQCMLVHTPTALSRTPHDIQSIFSSFWKVCLVSTRAEKRQVVCLGEPWGLKAFVRQGTVQQGWEA